MGTESEDRPPKVVCYKAGSELGELGLGKRFISYLLLWPACFSGRLGWWVPREYSLELELGTGKTGRVERKVSGDLCGPWRWGLRGGGYSKKPDTKTGVRLQDWI